MRAERAAALTNFVLILLFVAGLMAASSPSGAHVYSNPAKAAVQFAAITVLVAAPLGAVASWRTWAHARRYLMLETSGWRGVIEAGALGFALTLALRPGGRRRTSVRSRGMAPAADVCARPGVVGVYGLLGLAVGLVLGFLLRLSAIAVLLVHRRITS